MMLITYLSHTLNDFAFQSAIRRGQDFEPIRGRRKWRNRGNGFVVFGAFGYGNRPMECFEPLIDDVIEHRVGLFVRYEDRSLVIIKVTLEKLCANPFCPAFLQGHQQWLCINT